eukprot:3157793-Amphidinium_carterae.1
MSQSWTPVGTQYRSKRHTPSLRGAFMCIFVVLRNGAAAELELIAGLLHLGSLCCSNLLTQCALTWVSSSPPWKRYGPLCLEMECKSMRSVE